MTKDISAYLKKCLVCLTRAKHSRSVDSLEALNSLKPLQLISLELIDLKMRGNGELLFYVLIVDYGSRFIASVAMWEVPMIKWIIEVIKNVWLSVIVAPQVVLTIVLRIPLQLAGSAAHLMYL